MISALEQDVRSINSSLAQIENISDLICNDADVQRFFLKQFNTPSEEYDLSVRMLRSVDSLLRGMARSVRLAMIGYHPDLHEIVPNDFENRFSLKSHTASAIRSSGQVDVAVYRAERFNQDEWLELMKNSTQKQWCQTEEDRKNRTLSLIQPLTVSRYTDSSGGIKLTFYMDLLIPGLSNPSIGQEYDTYIVDADGRLVDSSTKDMEKWSQLIQEQPNLLQKAQDCTYPLKGSIAFTKPLSNEWQIIRVYAFSPVNRLFQIRFQFITIFLLSLLITFGLSYFIANHFSSRVHVIAGAVSQFAQGQLTVRIPYQGDRELDELALGFNKMAERIQSLIQDVYQTQILQQQQHLEMLQSQIRPHFLYNSLSAIVRLSERGDTSQVKAIAMALVQFYRISLSKGRDQIPFRDEIRHIHAYLDVCGIRYRDCFACTFSISPECEPCLVPKIILQPFVENALEHGMMDDQLLHIHICAEVHAGTLRITIEDDGIGVDSELLAAMESDRCVSVEGYGIRNVRERIRLAFGPSWGVHLSAVQPHGLRVVIVMPAQLATSHN